MNASVLLLDPDTAQSRQLRQALESQGDYVLGVSTAAIALAMLRHVHFDVLLVPKYPLTISTADLAAQAKLLQPALRVLVLDDVLRQPGAEPTLLIRSRRHDGIPPDAPAAR